MSQRRHQHASQPLGLDEIMIVNPGAPTLQPWPIMRLGTNAASAHPTLFLGDDGVIYALQAPGEPVQVGDMVVGADGTLKRARQPSADGQLGEDDLLDSEEDTPDGGATYARPAHRWRARRGPRNRR